MRRHSAPRRTCSAYTLTRNAIRSASRLYYVLSLIASRGVMPSAQGWLETRVVRSTAGECDG